MTPAAAIPTVTLNDDHAIPVLGLSVSDLPPADTEAAVAAALAAGYRLIDVSSADNEEAVGRAIAASPTAIALHSTAVIEMVKAMLLIANNGNGDRVWYWETMLMKTCILVMTTAFVSSCFCKEREGLL